MSESKKTLYEYIPHPHVPHRITAHDARSKMREEGGLNTAIAVFLTKHVGTMPIAYAFTLLAVIGLLGIIGILPPVANTLVSWTSQSFIQLVMLPVIMVGQAVLGKHQEMVSEKSYNDIEQVMTHLDKQDNAILDMAAKIEQIEKIEQVETLKQSDMLDAVLKKLEEQEVLLKTLSAPRTRSTRTHD